MAFPAIVPLLAAPPELRRRQAAAIEALYLVTEAGFFAGRRWQVGELVEIAEGEEDGPAVLVPRGFGRCTLGSVRGIRLFGVADEPCSPQRWAVKGRVCAVRRPVGSAWVREEVGHEEQLAA
ncbi:MAG: hypothetical protein H0V89_04075 [Deltaproteobacteria bacterium]|nr:hypothetical protein [Deltaproteobacteria bacterium]